MKKLIYLFLILISVASYGQAEFPESVQLTNQTSTTATKVNVQESNGLINTIAKADLIEVLEYSTASARPVTGVSGKIYVTIDSGRLYRWNGAVYNELLSVKENLANKQNSLTVDGTGVKYPTVDAVNNGLALKQNVITNNITGAGESGYMPYFNSSSTLTNTNAYFSSGKIGFGTTSPQAVLDIKGTAISRVDAPTGYAGFNMFDDTNSLAGSFSIGATLAGALPNTFFFGSRKAGNDVVVIAGSSVDSKIRIKGNSGNSLFKTDSDDGINTIQVPNGTISAQPATLSNQVVVKSQLDLKANISSPTFTGVPTVPTATAGTNTTQIASTAFVKSNFIELASSYQRKLGGLSVAINNSALDKTDIDYTGVYNYANTGSLNFKLQATGVSNGGFRLGTNSNYIEAREGFYTLTSVPIESPIATASNHLVTLSQVPKQLKDFYTDVNNIGITETDLYSYTTTQSRLNAAGEKIVAVYGGTMNDVTASSQLKVYFGGILIGDTGVLTMDAIIDIKINVSIIRTGATTARAILNIATRGASTPSYTEYTALTGLTFTNTNILKVTGTASGATGGDNDITATYGNIIWQPAAL